MIFNIKIITLFILLCIIGHTAKAACSVANGTINLGQTSSFTVYNSSINASSNIGLTCSGLLGLGILSGDRIAATVRSSTNNFRLVNTDGSGDAIPYGLFADSSYAHQFIINQPMDYQSIGLLTIILGGKSFTITLYARTSAGANVRAGTYTDVLTMYWDYSICSGIGLFNVCIGKEEATVTRTVTVTATISKQCVINSAPDINFGSYALVGQFNPITQSINLTCTRDEGYKVSFTNGNNRLANSWRRMVNGSNYLQYNIYQTDGVTIWDTNNKLSTKGTGLSQSIPYKAVINPSQAELPAGTYTDQVTVTVEY